MRIFAFQVNTKCLAPLLIAYDDELHRKDANLREYEVPRLLGS